MATPLRFLTSLVFFAVLAIGPALAQGATLDFPDVPDSAFDQDAYDGDEPRATKRMVVNADAVAPGDTVEVGILFEMDPGWHIYWRSAGQGGMSTELNVDTDSGTVSDTFWPEPTIYHEAGGSIITFGYSDAVLLFSEVTIGEDASDVVSLYADVDYLICEVDCIPGDAQLSRELPVADSTQEPTDGSRAWFEEAIEALPKSADERGLDITVSYSHAPIESPDNFRVEIDAIACQEPHDDCLELGNSPDSAADALVYDSISTIELSAARVSPHPDAHSGWFIELDGRATRDQPDGDGQFTGVLRLRDRDGHRLPTSFEELLPRVDSEKAQALVRGAMEISDADEEPDDAADAPVDSDLSLLYVLLLAFLGGALLNLMPCVFPVLAVKVFAFVNLAHEERHNIYTHSATYTAGIVASMMLLATAVIGLQTLGTQVGWGFQFQEPGFIAAVGAVLVVFALNLFGVFQVTLNPGRLQDVAQAPPGHRRSFGEGVLAVVLATPCSAPFLGTAVGFALASPPWVIALTFVVLGLGLAAPFVLLTLIPGAARFLPKPGPWMGHFKHVLGFALLGTAIWLLWIIGQMAGVAGVINLLIFLFCCALATWIFGLVQFKSGATRWIGIASALLIIAAAAVLTLGFEPVEGGPAAEPQAGDLAWKSWSDDDVQQQLEQGRPVFVNFTADWCITCKVNENNILSQSEVVDAALDHDVATFKADWTRRDDVIRAKLADHGKGGVPMYLLYSPDDPDNPRVLPEVLTRSMMISGFEEAAP